MPIEFTCTQCSSMLRVPDEHAGKQAKCPSCGTTVTVPSPSTDNAKHPESLYSQPAPQMPPQPSQTAPQPGGGQFAGAPVSYRNYAEPNRSGLILTLGILAIVANCMGIPGVMAWLMGSADLKKIKAGIMDPEGESLTKAGMIMGIIGTCFAALGLVFLLFYIIIIVFVVAAGAAAAV